MRHQANIWTNYDISSIRSYGIYLSKIWFWKSKVYNQITAFHHMICEMADILYRPQYATCARTAADMITIVILLHIVSKISSLLTSFFGIQIVETLSYAISSYFICLILSSLAMKFKHIYHSVAFKCMHFVRKHEMYAGNRNSKSTSSST